MTLATPVLFKGAPGSPYTRKMLALLRYRAIPHRLLVGAHDAGLGLPKPKVSLLPTFYLESDAGELEAVVDSTPIIRRLEREVPGRPVVPPDPLLAFVDYLLEDYADEWLTKAMFHYRWHHAADIDKAGRVLPRWFDVSAPEAEIEARRRTFTERQVGRLYVVGSNATTAPVIEASYARFLGIFTAILERQPFLMGARPGASDFGVHGQLTQLARFDPTPEALTLANAPRVYAWVELTDDLSGLEPDDGDWLTRDGIDVLRPLLAEVARTYVPVLLANADALAHGRDRVETVVDGAEWVQQPFPYQRKCLEWLRAERRALDPDTRAAADALLSGTGCEALFDED